MSSKVDELIDSVATWNEVVSLLEEVEKLQETAFKLEEKAFKSVLDVQVRSSLAEAIKADMVEFGDNIDSPEFLSRYLREVEMKLKSMTLVRVEVAKEPSRKVVGNVCSRLSEALDKPVVIDLRIDPELGGGARLTYGGRFCDYSFASFWPRIWAEVEEVISK